MVDSKNINRKIFIFVNDPIISNNQFSYPFVI